MNTNKTELTVRRGIFQRIWAAGLCLSFMAAFGVGTFAQCEKPVVLTASKTEYLDSAGNVERSEDEKSVLHISNSELIRYEPEGDDLKLDFKASVNSSKCDWKVPFKEGKSVLKVTFQQEGQTKDATITIEGKNGKVTLIAVVAEEPDRQIRVTADSFKFKE